MNILSIDPAARTGFAHSNGRRGIWELGEVKHRSVRLAEYIQLEVARSPTDVIAYEAAGWGSHNRHVKALHENLAGAIQTAAGLLGLEHWAWNPGTWKLIALGKGSLDKGQIIRMLRIIYGIDEPDSDIADAIGILLASTKGPPPESEKKRTRRAVKELLKRQQMLPGIKGRKRGA